MTLPTDYQGRKGFPLLTVLTAYFPDAVEALVELCKQGNVQHAVDANAVNPFKLEGDRVSWDRSKSMEQTETLMRHLWDHERGRRGAGNLVDADGQLHIVKVLWRAAAEAQLTIEALRAVKPMTATEVRKRSAETFERIAADFYTIADTQRAESIRNAIADQRPEWVDDGAFTKAELDVMPPCNCDHRPPHGGRPNA